MLINPTMHRMDPCYTYLKMSVVLVNRNSILIDAVGKTEWASKLAFNSVFDQDATRKLNIIQKYRNKRKVVRQQGNIENFDSF
jgi:hypothetical protein